MIPIVEPQFVQREESRLLAELTEFLAIPSISTLPELAGRSEDRVALRTLTDEVMRELQRLSGQEYVDEYAADVKARANGAQEGSA